MDQVELLSHCLLMGFLSRPSTLCSLQGLAVSYPLYRASLDIRLVRVEDAFVTGYCARAVGDVRKYHNPHFSCGELVERLVAGWLV